MKNYAFIRVGEYMVRADLIEAVGEFTVVTRNGRTYMLDEEQDRDRVLAMLHNAYMGAVSPVDNRSPVDAPPGAGSWWWA